VNLVESFRIALRALSANKVRSALTMLGVIIGVAAVILLVSIGTGVQSQVTGQISGLGSNLLFVFPGKMDEAGGPGGGGIRKQFNLDDVDYVQVRIGEQGTVIPLLQAPTELRVGNRTKNTTLGGTDQNGRASAGTLAEGRWFTRGEVVGNARVAVIGSDVRDEFFPGQNPVGRTIDVASQPFTIIGLFEAKGGSLGGSQDNVVDVPVTTAQQVLGTKDISGMLVEVNNMDQIEAVKAQVTRLLTPRFGDQFSVFTQEQTLGILSTLLGTLTAMLAGLASISLLVGGIGIMNIMLVSVSERTREIGIRKAVGARTYDILSQFVIEAMVLSVMGGVMGILVGSGGALALHRWVPAEVTLWAVVLAFAFSAAVGVFFGVYPAYRASRLDPIEALRYE
jgi:ABC-type antimicrobial peptide transport system permease subunit